MYSQLSMVRKPTTDEFKPRGTHTTLDPISRINEKKSMERHPLK
jgi:hypothetical protein